MTIYPTELISIHQTFFLNHFSPRSKLTTVVKYEEVTRFESQHKQIYIFSYKNDVFQFNNYGEKSGTFHHSFFTQP